MAGLDCHEICFYYLMKPKGQQFPSHSENETVEWIPLEELQHQTAYPNFLPELLPHIHQGIQHIITGKPGE